MVIEEVIKEWLLKHCAGVLRTIINESEDYDYDFTSVLSIFNSDKIQERRFQK